MAQPAAPHLARRLVRTIPFTAQKVFNQVVAAGASLNVAFDVGTRVTDRNQFLTPATLPTGMLVNPTPIPAIGPLIDWALFSDQAGTVQVFFAIDFTCLYRAVTPAIVVPASTFTNASGLRVTAHFVGVEFINTAGVNANVEFGAYVRSQ